MGGKNWYGCAISHDSGSESVSFLHYKMKADIAEEAVLAGLICKSGEWIPETWYPSTELRIFGTPTNSLIRSKPASEDRSPPSKFIFICLLLSKAKVFTILIKGSLGLFFKIRHLNPKLFTEQ